MITERAQAATPLLPPPAPRVDEHPHDTVLSEDVGLVHSVTPGVSRWDHPRLAPAFTVLADTFPIFGDTLDARPGGLAAHPRAAWHAAVGEAIERYSALHVPLSRVRRARRDQLDGAVADPEWLAGTTERPAVHWVAGAQLRPAGASVAAQVAASRVLLVNLDKHAPVLPPTSSGLASHTDPWRALGSGLAELIERDAFMRTWLHRSAPVPLETALRWREPDGRVVHFDRARESYRLFRLDSVVGVPVVLAVALGTAGQPTVAVGAGADLDLARACRRALVECFQTFHWTLHLQAEGRAVPQSAADLHDFDDHVTYYLDPSRLRAFDFLLHSGRPAKSVDLDAVGEQSTPQRRVDTLLARLEAAGLSAFAVDVTSPDVREAGLWVVRAAVPGLYPLHAGIGTRLDRHLLGDGELNPDPHPFP